MQSCGVPRDTCLLPGPGFTDSTSALRSLSKHSGWEHVAHLRPAQGTSQPTPRCPCHSARLSDGSARSRSGLDLGATLLLTPPHSQRSLSSSPTQGKGLAQESSGSLRGQGCGQEGEARPPPGWPSARSSSLPPFPPRSGEPGGHPAAAPALGRGAEPARHRPFPLPVPGGP